MNVFQIDQPENQAENGTTNVCEEHELAVRLQFKSWTIGRGNEKLMVEEASSALNTVFNVVGIGAVRTEHIIESENLAIGCRFRKIRFVKVYRAIVENVRADDDHDDYWTYV